jgi:predicted methyltransferase
VTAIVDAADRTDADRLLDPGRHPGELVTFLGLTPGMRVAELVAGTGYTTELLARTVGAKGKVWAENPAGFLKFVGAPYKERLARPVMKNVVRADRPTRRSLPRPRTSTPSSACSCTTTPSGSAWTVTR